MNLGVLEDRLGVTFKNKELLKKALTHSSYANEHFIECNERLEFLGDAVLELTISNYFYNNYSEDEGYLTKTRAKAVCEEALNIYSQKIGLNEFLLLGKGEENSGGRERPAIIADAFEAVLAAIFLEFGYEVTFKVVKRIVLPYLEEVFSFKDYKSIFQEKLQADKRTIEYKIISEIGPSNDKVFEAAVYMDGMLMGKGKGKSKQKAEQQAAKEALTKEAK